MDLPRESLTIGQLAKESGVGVETLRYYERLASTCSERGTPGDCPILDALEFEP